MLLDWVGELEWHSYHRSGEVQVNKWNLVDADNYEMANMLKDDLYYLSLFMHPIGADKVILRDHWILRTCQKVIN
jgi:hypothetical protein